MIFSIGIIFVFFGFIVVNLLGDKYLNKFDYIGGGFILYGIICMAVSLLIFVWDKLP